MNDDGMVGGMMKVGGSGRTTRKLCLSTTKPTWREQGLKWRTQAPEVRDLTVEALRSSCGTKLT